APAGRDVPARGGGRDGPRGAGGGERPRPRRHPGQRAVGLLGPGGPVGGPGRGAVGTPLQPPPQGGRTSIWTLPPGGGGWWGGSRAVMSAARKGRPRDASDS